jgi:hypothetical protein
MQTNWKILNSKRNPESGLVIEVTWAMKFKLDGESDRKIGKIKLEGDENDPNFIPFENLTKEIILNWVKSNLGQEKIEEIENQHKSVLETRLKEKSNPEFLLGLPWKDN